MKMLFNKQNKKTWYFVIPENILNIYIKENLQNHLSMGKYTSLKTYFSKKKKEEEIILQLLMQLLYSD